MNILWAGGLKDIRNAPPGYGYTGHSFNDYNHCDLTTMNGEVLKKCMPAAKAKGRGKAFYTCDRQGHIACDCDCRAHALKEDGADGRQEEPEVR